MDEPLFDRDIRHTEPDQTAHRRAQFHGGWRHGASGDAYTRETLRELTWNNLGYRLDRLFMETTPELIDQMYDWCVRQQAERTQQLPQSSKEE